MLGVLDALLLAHLLYDFHWQGDFIGTLKGSYLFLLFVHALTWALSLSFILQIYGIYSPWKGLFLLATHFIIDYWKSHKPADDPRKLTTWLWIDQFLHFITIIVVAL
jgi:uncharacterized membrane protein YozB (DUF420 family)